MRAKRITRCAVLAALAILLGWVERMMPSFSAVPGVKLGLGNMVVLFALWQNTEHPYEESFLIMSVKVCVTGLLFSGVTGFVYSLCGGVLSWLVMAVLTKTGKCSVFGVSVAGAAFHVTGQMLCAMLWLRSLGLLWYWALLLLCAVPAGLAIALLCSGVLRKMIKV